MIEKKKEKQNGYWYTYLKKCIVKWCHHVNYLAIIKLKVCEVIN